MKQAEHKAEHNQELLNQHINTQNPQADSKQAETEVAQSAQPLNRILEASCDCV